MALHTYFDRKLTYQFALFFHPRDWSDEDVDNLVKLIERPTDGENLGLRLRREDGTKRIVLHGGQLANQVQYSAPAAWRATWSPERLDLYFDAAGFASIRDSAPTIVEVFARSFAAVLEALPKDGEEAGNGTAINVSRAAVIVTGETDTPRDVPWSQVIGNLFEVSQATVERASGDFSVRINASEDWTFPDDQELPVLLIEAAAVNWRPQQDVRWFAWQFDVNTSPAAPLVYFREDIEFFFAQALDEIEKSAAKLEEAAGWQ